MCFGDGGDVGHSSEEEDDALQSRVETKETVIGSRGHDGYDPHGRLGGDVRKNHSCMRDNDGIPSPPPRPVAAMACIASVLLCRFLNLMRSRRQNG
jgi:hypothetical protein